MNSLIKNKYGFYEVENKPSDEELKTYYAEKYYQEQHSLYEYEYSENEKKYSHNKFLQKEIMLKKIFKKKLQGKTFLDIGCGEGYALEYFEKIGMNVVGVDFSDSGVKMHNNQQLGNLKVGDISYVLEAMVQDSMQFDVILMDNILEHVKQVENTLDLVKALLTENGIVMIEVPNDFSILQNKLLKDNLIDREYWVALPDHLSYFNNKSLINFCRNMGLQKVAILADFPIDLNLLEPTTNYIKIPEKGKELHRKRLVIENYLCEVDTEKLLEIYEILAEMGLGRNILGYFKKS